MSERIRLRSANGFSPELTLCGTGNLPGLRIHIREMPVPLK
jgi:hypothetical protein